MYAVCSKQYGSIPFQIGHDLKSFLSIKNLFLCGKPMKHSVFIPCFLFKTVIALIRVLAGTNLVGKVLPN